MVRFLPKWASKLVGRRQPNHDLSAASVEVEDNPSDRLLEVTSGAETPLPATQVIEVRDIEVEDNPSDRLLEATSGAETPLPATQVIEVRDIEESREVSSCGHWYVLKIGSYANLFLMIAFVFWGPTPVYIAESYLPPVPNIVAFRIHDWLSKPGCTAVYSRDCLARRWNYYMSLLICLVGSSVLLAQVVVCAVFGARGFFRQATGLCTVHNGVDDTWAVTPIVATVSSITFCTFCAWLTVQESVRGRLSTGNGLSWEAWIAFVLYNSFDVLLQALARGMSASDTLEASDLFIMDRVALLHMPILGSRMDTFKDLVFIALCFQEGLPILTFLALITLLGTQVRTWAMHHLRYEIRHDHVPILRPKLRDMLPDDMHGMPMTGFKGFVLKQLKAASLPIKQETAFLEDLPQAILQTVSFHFIGGSSFVVFSLVVACVKGGGVVILAHVLRAYGTTSDHLTNLVSSPIPWWRLSAAVALHTLGKNPGDDVLQAVKDALESDPDSVVRLTAAQVLEKFGGTEALPSLKKALESDSVWNVRRNAAEALGNIGGPEALAALTQHFRAHIKSSDWEYRRSAANAAGAIGQIDPKSEIAAEALQPLKNSLESYDSEWVRADAAKALGEIGGPGALQALKKPLALDFCYKVRAAAAKALGKIGGPEALQASKRALESDLEWLVRAEAAEALGNIGGPEALQPLKQVLESDENVHVRRAAAVALGEIGGPEALAALTQHFRAHIKSSDWEYRVSAANAAGAIGQIDPKSEIAAEAITALKAAIEHEGWSVLDAEEALTKLGA